MVLIKFQIQELYSLSDFTDFKYTAKIKDLTLIWNPRVFFLYNKHRMFGIRILP